MHAKSGGSCGEPPDFLFIPAACRSRKDLPRSAGEGDRARNTGNRPRDAEDGGTGTGAGCGARETGARARAQGAGPRVRGAGCGARVRNTEDAGVGRRTQNAEHVKRGRGHGHGARARGHGVQDAGRRTRATGRGQQNTGNAGTGRRRRGIGDGAQAPVHGPQRDCIHPPGPATTCLDRSQPGAIRRRDQSAGTFHGWTPAAGTRNNPPGHSQPGAIRHRDLQQPAGAVHSRAPSAAGRRYLSRVRIRITPLPPRTPYMLLPRCTSTDLTS